MKNTQATASGQSIEAKIVQGLLIAPIRFYQYAISPLTPASCRHVPSCSEYSVQAIRRHGVLRGSRLAANRIARCHPWGTSGFDPVPLILVKKMNMKKYQPHHRKFAAFDLLKSKPVMLLLLAFVLLVSCNSNQSNTQSDHRNNNLVVSILPEKYFVDKIAGPGFKTTVLIPPGMSPHAYDPTPKQMADIARASIFFYNGNLAFEKAWINNLHDAYPYMETVRLSKGIAPIEPADSSHHENADPHTWLSPANAKIIAKNIHDALIADYPEEKDRFDKNYHQLIDSIDTLDRQIRKILSDMPGRRFMIYHPSLTYFAREYNLQEIPIEVEGKEPAPAQLMASIDTARADGIHAIFIQQEFDNDFAKSIAKEINGRVVQINPLAENWSENLLHIAREISQSYSKQTP